MILLALALALSFQPPPGSESYLTDPAFAAAYRTWAQCTDRQIDAAAASARAEEEIVGAAHAACAAEEAAARAVIVTLGGEANAAAFWVEMRAAERNSLIGRLRERRGPAAAPADERGRLISAWVSCVMRRIEATAAATPEREAVDSALDSCGTEQEAMRRFGVAQGGSARARRFIDEARALYSRQMLTYLRDLRSRPRLAD